jgi:hypothetical protein
MKRTLVTGAVLSCFVSAPVLAQPDPGQPDPGGDAGGAGGNDAGGGGDTGDGTGPGLDPNVPIGSVDPENPDEGNIADDLGVAPEVFTARLYGYVDAHFEKSQAQPGLDEMGNTAGSKQAAEFDVTNLNIMLQGRIYGRYRYFINLSAPGSGSPTEDAAVGLRNGWVEFPVYRDFFNFRIGKTYRRFGLYNEILDATPTFIGIEPPEMFDSDHLMLTRTTNAMLHGTIVSGSTSLSYALTAGNDERRGAQLPFGADLRFDFAGAAKVGVSYYNSNGDAAPTVDVGSSPLGGVINWMEKDKYQVYSAFAQVMTKGLTLQAEYTKANHDAFRNPAAVYNLVASDAGLIPRQLEQFFRDPDMPSEDNVITDVSYGVTAIYGRAGYEIPIYKQWTVTPYAQLDYYKNIETIGSEDFGGDNEAGLTDDGKFLKYTLGVVFRPVRFVAIKVDGSVHSQEFNGATYNYAEVRTSWSLYWELGDGE